MLTTPAPHSLNVEIFDTVAKSCSQLADVANYAAEPSKKSQTL